MLHQNVLNKSWLKNLTRRKKANWVQFGKKVENIRKHTLFSFKVPKFPEKKRMFQPARILCPFCWYLDFGSQE